MTDPIRIQRKRTKGWRMPAGAVYVGRPSKWGNPHDWREYRDNAPRDMLWPAAEVNHWCHEMAVDAFAEDIREPGYAREVFRAACRGTLRGKTLACWCALDQPCHADVLLELANQ